MKLERYQFDMTLSEAFGALCYALDLYLSHDLAEEDMLRVFELFFDFGPEFNTTLSYFESLKARNITRTVFLSRFGARVGVSNIDAATLNMARQSGLFAPYWNRYQELAPQYHAESRHLKYNAVTFKVQKM